MAPKSSGSAKEPNPFALPQETDGRFRMLIVTALILVWSLGSQILTPPSVMDSALAIGPNFRQAVAEMMDAAKRNPFAVPLPTTDDGRLLLETGEFWRMVDIYYAWLKSFLLSALLSIFFAVLAAIFYFAFPSIYRIRYQTRPMSRELAPRATRELDLLAERAGLDEKPDLLVKPGILDGLAFHRWRRQYLALAGEPATLDRSWGDLQRAVALHEIGHLVNGDIRKREVARALWISLGATLAVAVVFLFWLRDPAISDLAIFFGRTFGVVLVAWILWGGLVRAREFYADWRVVTWGLGAALSRRLSLPDPLRAEPGWWPRVQSLWRMHPANAERLKMLREPKELFAASPLLAALTGTLLGLVTGNAAILATDWLVAAISTLGVAAALTRNSLVLVFGFLHVPVALLALVVVGRWTTDALGVQILRSAMWDLGRDSLARWGYGSLARLAAAFVVGLEAGLTLTTAAFFGWGSPLFMVLWWVGFFVMIWLWMVQSRALGRILLGACSGEKIKARVVFWLRWLATLQLAVLFLPALAGRFAAHIRVNPEMLMLLDGTEGDVIGTSGFFISSSFIFLTLSFLLFASLGAGVLTIAVFRLVRRKVFCPRCGPGAGGWRSVGEGCSRCGALLGSWFYRPPEGYRRLDAEGGGR
jgi:hypothetical protein